jgi:hypothetical protein
MGYAKDLLAVAERYDLTSTEAEKRRCVSTAYYIVFDHRASRDERMAPLMRGFGGDLR